MNTSLTSEEIVNNMPIGLLAWYVFDKGEDILWLRYIDGGAVDKHYDSLIEYLKGRGKAIDILDVTRDDAYQIADDKSYSYVIALELIEKVDRPEALLDFCKKLLKPEGTLLLGATNAWGLKYFCGEQDPYTGRNYDGIEGYRNINAVDRDKLQGQLYTRSQLDDFLAKAGFISGIRQYSVFPSLTWPQMIIREDTFSAESFWGRYFPMYDSPSTCFLEEDYLYERIRNSMIFHQLADAFLLECSLDGTGDGACNVTVSTDRGYETATATVIREDNKVQKVPLFAEGKANLTSLYNNMQKLKARGLSVVDMTITDGTITMPYLKGINGVEYFSHLYENEGREAFIQKIEEFVSLIYKSSDYYTDEKTGEVVLKEGYVDLCPINCIVAEGEFVFIDQEFVTHDMPVKCLINRLIDIAYGGDNRLETAFSREYFDKKYQLGDNRTKWIRPINDFINRMRNQNILAEYLAHHKKDLSLVNANRQRMNFSASEYEKIFTGALRGLKDKQVYIFGSGRYAESFLMFYGKRCQVAGLLDNNPAKWGQQLSGVTIGPPDMLRQLEPKSYKVIICIKNYMFVLQQLKAMGVENIGIYDSTREYDLDESSDKGEAIGSGAQILSTAVDNFKQNQLTGQVIDAIASEKKYNIGYIAGVFDLFHIGHLNLLKRAKEQCNYLIVGIVSDEGVRKNKGAEPYVPFEERLSIVASSRYVDRAVEIPYGFAGTRDAYKLYHFDVQFSGSDYIDNPAWLADKQYLQEHGADMVFFPYTKSTSSTKLKAAIDTKAGT